MLEARETKSSRCGKNGTGKSARGSGLAAHPLCHREPGPRSVCIRAPGNSSEAIGARVGRTAPEVAGLERATAAAASHGRCGELHLESLGGAERFLFGWRSAHR